MSGMPDWMLPSDEDERRAWEPFPTPAEAQAELERNWDGPRCPHGKPVGMMMGFDNPCGPCESEMARDAWEDEEELRAFLEARDREEV